MIGRTRGVGRRERGMGKKETRGVDGKWRERKRKETGGQWMWGKGIKSEGGRERADGMSGGRGE